MNPIYPAIPLLCLAGALLTGLAGRALGRQLSHLIAIFAVGAAFFLSLRVYWLASRGLVENVNWYAWAITGDLQLSIGFLIDPLSALMMLVVTGVSLMVHIYSIGYMADDPGYQRFFCYIGLFTFSMLMLVMSNNFLQLFFGWEAVGLVSYLLIGFWFQRPSAAAAGLKAFLVNRVGDFGFLLGIAGLLYLFNSLDYASVFANAGILQNKTFAVPWGGAWQWSTLICLLLFVGAMGKSAQVPLHVWLPDSMEGPTPISALIHAATMVTAGIFMVARMSPLFEWSATALEVVLLIGCITAFGMALVALVQTDIKRVVAYSTLSQLGYMTAALGISAYPLALFHLATHAFFKALLFLGAGSVIIAMHHIQDMRQMGGLRRWMPITYVCMWIGCLALAGFPPFSGFFSKDAIIEAMALSDRYFSGIGYWALLSGVFLTAFYSFRMLFLTFHGRCRADETTRAHLQESPDVVTWPLITLAAAAVLSGMLWFSGVLTGAEFGSALTIHWHNDVVARLAANYGWREGIRLVLAAIGHGFVTPAFWLALGGLFCAWIAYCPRPQWLAPIAAQIENKGGELLAHYNLQARLQRLFDLGYRILVARYGFDALYQRVFIQPTLHGSGWLHKHVDAGLIDHRLVGGIARRVVAAAGWLRQLQSGLIYHYAFAMVIGLLALMTWFIWR